MNNLQNLRIPYQQIISSRTAEEFCILELVIHFADVAVTKLVQDKSNTSLLS
jgi:hypothetical protein